MFRLSSAFMHIGKFILVGHPISVKNVERPSSRAWNFNIKKSMPVSNTMSARDVGIFIELAQLLKLIRESM